MNIFLTNMSTWDNFLQLIGVSILFVFVLAITYFTTKFVAGIKQNNTNSNFKVIETFKVTNNKFLQIIQIGQRYFLISISKDDIRYLAELNEGDIKTNNGHLQKPVKFSEILSKYSPKFNPDKEEQNEKQNEKQSKEH